MFAILESGCTRDVTLAQALSDHQGDSSSSSLPARAKGTVLVMHILADAIATVRIEHIVSQWCAAGTLVDSAASIVARLFSVF